MTFTHQPNRATYTLKVTRKLDEERQNTVVVEGDSRDTIGKSAEDCTVLLDAWAKEIESASNDT